MLCALLSYSGSTACAQPGTSPTCDMTPKYGSPDDMIQLRTRAWNLLLTIANKPVVNSADWIPRQDAFAQAPRITTPTKSLTLFFAKEFDRAESSSPSAKAALVPQPQTYESTFFNRSAYTHIRDRKYPLYSRATTKKLQIEESRGEIPEFPKDALVLKTFWRRVPDKGSVNVGVWKWNNIQKGTFRMLETMWPNPVCVEVKHTPNSKCVQARDAFYTITTTQENSPEFLCVASNPDCAPSIPKGQTMILVGMHVASKEKPEWFWATFWWQGVDRQSGASPSTASWTCDNAQRPSALGTGVWSNYSMDVRTRFADPKPPITADDSKTCGSPPTIGKNEELLATYNPFIEGTSLLGFKSSCIDCHSRADTNATPDTSVPQVCAVGGPNLTIFQGHVRTDYLWSIMRFLENTRSKP